MTQFSGTKEQIFDVFVELTSAMGYENVSIRDVAKKVGINPASIYYHFESKEKILEFAYDYYIEHQYDNRHSIEEMKTLIETASAEDFIASLTFTFETEDQKKYVRMILITKIIYMRIYQDPIANRIFFESDQNNSEYALSILKHGVKKKRIAANFDIETFVRLLIGSMQVMGVKSFSDPSYSVGQLEQEKNTLAMLSKLLATAMK